MTTAGNGPATYACEVIGHGGASAYYPGNSRSSIVKALEIGVDRIEIDVRCSADRDLVLVHDKALSVEGGRRRPVKRLTTHELRGALPGLLTLDDLVALNRDRVPLLLDLKAPGYERELIAAIRRYELAATSAASSTHASTLRRLHQAFPTMRLGLSTGHLAAGIPIRAVRLAFRETLRAALPVALGQAAALAGATEVMVQYQACTERLVRGMHASGRRVNVWTVDRPDHIRQAIALGVDSITSNRPDLVRQILAEETSRRS